MTESIAHNDLGRPASGTVTGILALTSAAVSSPRAGTREILRGPIAGALLLALSLATYARADADLWGHVRFGLDTLESWRLPAEDPYSFTQDTPWINHEWLSELQMAAAWRIAGTTGLVALKGALTLGTLLLIWARLAASGWPRASQFWRSWSSGPST